MPIFDMSAMTPTGAPPTMPATPAVKAVNYLAKTDRYMVTRASGETVTVKFQPDGNAVVNGQPGLTNDDMRYIIAAAIGLRTANALQPGGFEPFISARDIVGPLP